MTDSEPYVVGKRVRVIGKDVEGMIAFYGTTTFAPEKWLGIKLDEPKGKNNGNVQGVEYFKCDDKFGLFVKPSQVILLSEQKKGSEDMKYRRQTGIPSKPKPTSIRRKSPKRPPLSTSSSRISMPTSLHSLSSSRQSLSSSRTSLSESKQSLSDSRTQLDASSKDKQTSSPSTETGVQILKRSSFVETGFVESFEPHFTPGQIITPTPTPITSIEEKVTIIQLQHEIEHRNQQIKDLNEKLETLKIRRTDDKERLKELDKLRIQHEHLMEFKMKIMETQTNLQRELQRAKQEAQDAIDAKNQHADEVADLAETVEMATLDREMAEEKAETLQLELDHCKEKLEETKLDLEILKTEMQNRLGGVTNDGGENEVTTFEIKQLQQQNLRLRETLVRLRDLSAHDKHEYQKLTKDVDQKKSEILELGKTKEKLSSRVEVMENQIADLQEQVDAALGAEEMVVILGEQKLNLEEKVSNLQEDVTELEALQEMNDQLVESNTELEADLREELDLVQADIRRINRERDAAHETIADRESTILKFRELVQKLQEQSLNLQQRLEQETSRPVSMMPEIIDFTKMFFENKAHTKAIDLELRHIEIQQLRDHIKYLMAYMPHSFLKHGSDHDAVLSLLLTSRLLQKCQILLIQLKEKFPICECNDRTAILKGHDVEQYSYRCRLSFSLYNLQLLLNQYGSNLNSCSAEIFLKMGASYTEIMAQEKIIDGFLELLKHNQLDENVSTENLEKCTQFFYALYLVIFSGHRRINDLVLLLDFIKGVGCGAEYLQHSGIIIKNLLQTPNIGKIADFCHNLITNGDNLIQQSKLIKRRLPQNTAKAVLLAIKPDTVENVYNSFSHFGKVMKTLHEIIKNALKESLASEESDKGLPSNAMEEIAISASDKVYEQDDLGPIQSVKSSLEIVDVQCQNVAKFLQDNEYEINVPSGSGDNKSAVSPPPPPPITVRANIVRDELEQTKTLTSKLENKESHIKDLRKAFKEKQEQLSEMTIRKELAEKKLGNVNKDYELTIEKLQRKLDEAHNNYKKKEKEFEETLDHLQTDIDSLESEKGEMKEKLRMLSKKAQMEMSLTKLSPMSLSSSNGGSQSIGPVLPAVVRDSPHLLQEITNLRKLFKTEHNERLKLQTDDLLRRFGQLSPLPKFDNKPNTELTELLKNGTDLRREILSKLSRPIFPSLDKVNSSTIQLFWKNHLTDEKAKMQSLQQKAIVFHDKVIQEVVKRSSCKVEADFKTFPAVDLTKALNSSDAVNIGFVKIPPTLMDSTDTSKIIDLNLDCVRMQKILNSFV